MAVVHVHDPIARRLADADHRAFKDLFERDMERRHDMDEAGCAVAREPEVQREVEVLAKQVELLGHDVSQHCARLAPVLAPSEPAPPPRDADPVVRTRAPLALALERIAEQVRAVRLALDDVGDRLAV